MMLRQRAPMARVALVATLVAALAFVACSPASTAPAINVSGSWRLQGIFYADSDTLQLTGLTMNLTQSGQAFSGPYSGAVITVNVRPYYSCCAGTPPLSGEILAGTISGATVEFSLDNSSQRFEGVMNDTAMAGSGTIYHTDIAGNETFTGTWTAQRN